MIDRSCSLKIKKQQTIITVFINKTINQPTDFVPYKRLSHSDPVYTLWWSKEIDLTLSETLLISFNDENTKTSILCTRLHRNKKGKLSVILQMFISSKNKKSNKFVLKPGKSDLSHLFFFHLCSEKQLEIMPQEH